MSNLNGYYKFMTISSFFCGEQTSEKYDAPADTTNSRKTRQFEVY